MSEAARIAAGLVAGDDMSAAAYLVALVDDEAMPLKIGSVYFNRQLRRVGCLDPLGHPTSFGRQVAMVLRAQHGITPRPGSL